jgi:hypothetical protein
MRQLHCVRADRRRFFVKEGAHLRRQSGCGRYACGLSAHARKQKRRPSPRLDGVLFPPKEKFLTRLRRRARKETFALRTLARQLAGAADSFRTFTRALFRRLFVMVTALHFAESAFPLHLLFERLQRLIDVVIADENLYQGTSPVTKNA